MTHTTVRQTHFAAALIAAGLLVGCQSPQRKPDGVRVYLPDGTDVTLPDDNDDAPVVRGQSPFGGQALPSFDPRQPPPGQRYAPVAPRYQQPVAPNFQPPPYQAPGFQPPVYQPAPVQPRPVQPYVQPPPNYAPARSPFVAPQVTPPAYAVQPGQPLVANPQLAPPGGYFGPALANPVPFDEGTVDITGVVQEAPTGRVVLGFGINSDAGVVGTLVVDEQNFDWRRFPRSFQEITNGVAFRGAGQQFRIEAVPGDQVQRYTFSFREPFLFDTRLSFGVSAFFYNRRFDDWDEQRLGGRLTFGYQLRHDLSATLTLRAEDIDVTDPAVPTPDELAAVVGSNDLFSVRFALAHDTRDSSFLPTEGHLLQLNFEQAFGEFDFPRVTAEYRRYFLIRQRIDRSGRQVLSFRGQVGFTGKQTPIMEHFFAGGFTTLRGYDFRGASPRVGTVEVGGDFQALGSVQYMMPITPDDMMRFVAFVDFGTVERRVALKEENFRVAPGLGLRLTIPAMGPAPLAFDFAFPIASAEGDDEEVFSFFIGLMN